MRTLRFHGEDGTSGAPRAVADANVKLAVGGQQKM